MEVSVLEVYKNKKVFITGDSGFKGSWLVCLLQHAGAIVTGYSLIPNTTPNHFGLLNNKYVTTTADILELSSLTTTLQKAQPEIVFHLAAQALVRTSYVNPIATYQSNVIGTLHLLEAAKNCASVKAIVLITTDKVYENKESTQAYMETDELGGYDMYSSSKACCELLIKSYRSSFLHTDQYKKSHHILIATARAGNVIGGGDWNEDRLIPDMVRKAADKKTVQIRNPKAVRPWQHVLDCLYGYLLLGTKLLKEDKAFSGAWNFSPFCNEVKNVSEIAAIAKKSWADIEIEFGTAPENFHEAGLLILDNTKAVEQLHWQPVWNTTEAVEKTIEWYKAFYYNGQIITQNQIADFVQKIQSTQWN